MDTCAETVKVEVEGHVLVCHHPRENIWCCCAEEGAAQCCCGPTLESAICAWVRNEELGE